MGRLRYIVKLLLSTDDLSSHPTFNFQYQTQNFIGYCMAYFSCGLHLGPLFKDIELQLEKLAESGEESFYGLLLPMAQLVFFLQRDSDDEFLAFAGTAMTEESFMDIVTRNKTARQLVYQFRMIVRFHFGDIRGAAEAASNISHLGVPHPLTLTEFMYQGLVEFGLARVTKKRRHYRRGLRLVRKVEKFVRLGSVNGECPGR